MSRAAYTTDIDSVDARGAVISLYQQ